MFIKRLCVKNFKSFQELDIELGSLNVLVGANASGKSNLITVLNFLKNIISNGLNSAISQEGGFTFLVNNQIKEKKSLEIRIDYTSPNLFTTMTKISNIETNLSEVSYEFALDFNDMGYYNISKDTLNLTYNFNLLDPLDDEIVIKNLGTGNITFFIESNSSQIKMQAGHLPASILKLYERNDFPIPFLRQDLIRHDWDLLINSPLFKVLAFEFNFLPSLQNIPIYDFDPKELKKMQSLAGRLTLEENGSNLSLILRNILNQSEQKRKLNNLISYLLPHIKDVHIQSTGNSLYFETEEIYANDSITPSIFLSPGTVNIIALIVALYFENKPVIIIEEPERNIHPGLISKLMELFKEVAHDKQIILTTHNPQLVKHTDLASLYLVSRDKEGFSIVTKPGEGKEIYIFLENDLGLDDLYVQSFLEGWA